MSERETLPEVALTSDVWWLDPETGRANPSLETLVAGMSDGMKERIRARSIQVRAIENAPERNPVASVSVSEEEIQKSWTAFRDFTDDVFDRFGGCCLTPESMWKEGFKAGLEHRAEQLTVTVIPVSLSPEDAEVHSKAFLSFFEDDSQDQLKYICNCGQAFKHPEDRTMHLSYCAVMLQKRIQELESQLKVESQRAKVRGDSLISASERIRELEGEVQALRHEMMLQTSAMSRVKRYREALEKILNEVGTSTLTHKIAREALKP